MCGQSVEHASKATMQTEGGMIWRSDPSAHAVQYRPGSNPWKSPIGGFGRPPPQCQGLLMLLEKSWSVVGVLKKCDGDLCYAWKAYHKREGDRNIETVTKQLQVP